MRRALRIFACVLVGIVCLALALVVSALILIRSEWGHQRIANFILPRIEAALAGSLSVGHIGGDLTHSLILDDVLLHDAEGEPAIRVRRVEAHFSIATLLAKRLSISDVKIEGAWVHARPLKNGELNLAALVKPTPDSPTSSEPSTFVVTIAHLALQGQAIYDIGGDLKRLATTLTLEGDAAVHGAKVDANLKSLNAKVSEPIVASLSAAGGVQIADGPVRVQKAHADIETNGRDLAQLLKRLEVHALDGRVKSGDWKIAVRADGTLAALSVEADVAPTSGSIKAQGELKLVNGAPQYQAAVQVHALDPGALLVGIPHATIALSAHAHGTGGKGQIDLEKLRADSLGTQIDGHGSFDFKGEGQVSAHVKSTDLSRLREVGGPNIRGALLLDAQVRRGARLDIKGIASIKGLVVGTTRIGQLAAKIDTHDFVGTTEVKATGLQFGNIRYDWLNVNAEGSRRALSAHIDAEGPPHTKIHLHAQGTPIPIEGRLTGVDVNIVELVIGIPAEEWTGVKPAHFRYDHTVTIENLLLKSGAQTLAVNGVFDPENTNASAHVRTDKLDLKPLLELFSPRSNLPSTAITAAIDGEYRGREHRAKATVSIDDSGHSIKAQLDLPTSFARDEKLSLDLTVANVDLERWSDLLPGALATFKGQLGAQVKLAGTVRLPTLDANLTLADWELATFRRGTLAVNASYHDQKLTAGFSTEFSSANGVAGIIDGNANTHLDFERVRRGEREAIFRSLPLDLDVRVQKLDLPQLPWTLFGMTRAPLDKGKLDATLKVSGTPAAPVIALDIDATDLKREQLDRTHLRASAHYAAKQATVDGEIDLRDAKLLALHVSSKLDLESRKIDFRTLPLSFNVQLGDYDLSKVADLILGAAGNLKGQISGEGTLSAPKIKGALSIDQLSLGETKFSQFEVEGAFDREIAVALKATEVSGGQINIDGKIPRGASQALTAKIVARNFRFDVQLPNPSPVRLFRGLLAADLDVSGTTGSPNLAGEVHFTQGSLGIAGSSRPYEDVAVDVKVQNGTATLSQIKVRYGAGTITGSGQATFSADAKGGVLSPKTVSIKAHAQNFPVIGGPAGSLVDGDVTIEAQRENDLLVGKILVENGIARLPKVESGKSLQSTGALKDVVFEDAQARREREEEARAKVEADRVQLSTRIPEFKVRSKEASIDLKGNLEIDLTSKLAKISGSVEALGGWLELIGRKYRIDHARIGFDGSPDLNPSLDIRISRDVTDTTVMVDVHGSARKPTVKFSSDPPIYDEAQVLGIIISGDPADQQTSDRSLASQAVGVISNVVIGKIKDQLAPSLPIDVLKIDVAGDSSNPAAQTRLEVGKYLTDNIYVSYIHTFGQQISLRPVNSNEAQVEYRFAKRFTLQTVFGDAEVGGVDLLWRLRY